MEANNEILELITTTILFLGVIIAIVWQKNSKDKQRQETLRILLEKGLDTSDPQVQKIIGNGSFLSMDFRPGIAYKIYLVSGIMSIFTGLAWGVMLLILTYSSESPNPAVGIAIAALMVIIGAGLLLCTRFVTKPKNK